LAWPFSGAAATRTSSALPSPVIRRPAQAVFDAPGITFTRSDINPVSQSLSQGDLSPSGRKEGDAAFPPEPAESNFTAPPRV
jgi:hypothetical protein